MALPLGLILGGASLLGGLFGGKKTPTYQPDQQSNQIMEQLMGLAGQVPNAAGPYNGPSGIDYGSLFSQAQEYLGGKIQNPTEMVGPTEEQYGQYLDQNIQKSRQGYQQNVANPLQEKLISLGIDRSGSGLDLQRQAGQTQADTEGLMTADFNYQKALQQQQSQMAASQIMSQILSQAQNLMGLDFGNQQFNVGNQMDLYKFQEGFPLQAAQAKGSILGAAGGMAQNNNQMAYQSQLNAANQRNSGLASMAGFGTNLLTRSLFPDQFKFDFSALGQK